MRSFLLFFISFLVLSSFRSEAGEVQVRSQEEFDRLGGRIRSELLSGDDVHVRLDSGLYFFSERHLVLDSLFCPGSALRSPVTEPFWLDARDLEKRRRSGTDL